MDSAFHHIMLLIEGAFVGASGLALVAHAVNTFPTPKNPYGAWLLGTIQFAVGQRVAAANTKQGLQTVATGVPAEKKGE